MGPSVILAQGPIRQFGRHLWAMRIVGCILRAGRVNFGLTVWMSTLVFPSNTTLGYAEGNR